MGDEATLALPDMAVWQQTLAWQPNDQQQQQFQQLYHLVLQGNQSLNLTRITDPTEFWEKHLWDSLRGIFPRWAADSPSTRWQVIDIGTGAGFPGVPVAIACPTWQVTLMDSTRKKTTFLEALLGRLMLENAGVLTNRAEQVGQQSEHRAAYDLALIRAVAGASVCAEYTLPLLKVGGQAVLYRGQWTAEETTELQSAVEKLGGAIAAIELLTTPLSEGLRHCIYLKKVKRTPVEFPRAVGVPTQHPL